MVSRILFYVCHVLSGSVLTLPVLSDTSKFNNGMDNGRTDEKSRIHQELAIEISHNQQKASFLYTSATIFSFFLFLFFILFYGYTSATILSSLFQIEPTPDEFDINKLGHKEEPLLIIPKVRE